jgi:dihydrofolate reductase
VQLDGRRPVVVASRPVVHPGAAAQPRGSANVQKERVANEPIIVPSLTAALSAAENLPGEIYVCGGERIYAETLALARPMRLHLTLIHAEIPGDTFFPEWRHLSWRELARRESSDANFRYTFFTLERHF